MVSWRTRGSVEERKGEEEEGEDERKKGGLTEAKHVPIDAVLLVVGGVFLWVGDSGSDVLHQTRLT